MPTTAYRNPWHTLDKPEYGPALYETDEKPMQYRGYLIYQRVTGYVWDVVLDGACVAQMAGPHGAARAIDKLIDRHLEWANAPEAKA